MKTINWATIPVALLTLCVALAQNSSASTPLPVGLSGELTANPKIVQVGETPKLTWKINYPPAVLEVVDVNNPGGGSGSGSGGGGGVGTITTKTKLYTDVRILGQGVTIQNGNTFSFVNTQASMSINSTSDFKQIFYGTNPQVNPANIINLKTVFGDTYRNNLVAAGTPIRFGGRYYYNSAWGPNYRSSDGGDNVRFLVNGEIPPSNIPGYNAPSLESFIRPYLDSTGRVKIGPMDVIVFMELTHRADQKSNIGYDLQDMVLLVTFRKP
jgi:hypothetical protein